MTAAALITAYNLQAASVIYKEKNAPFSGTNTDTWADSTTNTRYNDWIRDATSSAGGVGGIGLFNFGVNPSGSPLSYSQTSNGVTGVITWFSGSTGGYLRRYSTSNNQYNPGASNTPGFGTLYFNNTSTLMVDFGASRINGLSFWFVGQRLVQP